jgi:16S rRNA (cytidine1402-2'-O)-methyltransferase
LKVSEPEADVSNAAALYVVATPIGNLEDMTPRAVRILTSVDLIAAEDTRHSAKLLHHFGIATKMVAVHEHNEREQIPRLLDLLRSGKSIALISDAGTPLVSDPGFHLVRAAREAGISAVPIPGACAAVAALSVSGLPSDRFVFAGFPPARAAARRRVFESLCHETRTLIFYETPHRVVESLGDMATVFGPEREAVLARELTKKFETTRSGTLAGLHDWVRRDENQQRGEFAILVHGEVGRREKGVDQETERVLRLLLAELPLRQAASLAAAITGGQKNLLYRTALSLKRKSPTAHGKEKEKK